MRAKKKIRLEKIGLGMPGEAELSRRLDAVLAVLYLIFNEGYSAQKGESIVREDLCREAIRLTELLARHQLTGGPKVEALLALMLLQAARLPARQNGSAFPWSCFCSHAMKSRYGRGGGRRSSSPAHAAS